MNVPKQTFFIYLSIYFYLFIYFYFSGGGGGGGGALWQIILLTVNMRCQMRKVCAT